MSDELKFRTTAVIWGALAAILIFTVADKVALAFILGIAAAVSTIVVWESAKVSAEAQSEARASKQKRDSRVRRLVEMMDDDEVAEMEAYLEARRDERLQ